MLTGLGVICFAGILGGTAAALFFLSPPYVGEIHGALRQTMATLWAAVVLFGGLRAKFTELPFWQLVAPVLIKAFLTFVLLGTVWNADLSWEYSNRESLSLMLTVTAVASMLLLDYLRLRKSRKNC